MSVSQTYNTLITNQHEIINNGVLLGGVKNCINELLTNDIKNLTNQQIIQLYKITYHGISSM